MLRRSRKPVSVKPSAQSHVEPISDLERLEVAIHLARGVDVVEMRDGARFDLRKDIERWFERADWEPEVGGWSDSPAGVVPVLTGKPTLTDEQVAALQMDLRGLLSLSKDKTVLKQVTVEVGIGTTRAGIYTIVRSADPRDLMLFTLALLMRAPKSAIGAEVRACAECGNAFLRRTKDLYCDETCRNRRNKRDQRERANARKKKIRSRKK